MTTFFLASLYNLVCSAKLLIAVSCLLVVLCSLKLEPSLAVVFLDQAANNTLMDDCKPFLQANLSNLNLRGALADKNSSFKDSNISAGILNQYSGFRN